VAAGDWTWLANVSARDIQNFLRIQGGWRADAAAGDWTQLANVAARDI
jgi:hypothetical protein